MGIFVGYDSKKRRLIVDCGFNDNHIAKAFPSRKFDPKFKHWKVTMCRKNIEYLERIAQKCTIDAEAMAAIKAHKVKTERPPITPFPLDYPFKTQPFGHQRTALNLCWNVPYFALFMEMGTGKSKVCIDKAANHYQLGEINGLVITCPVSIRTNWVDELHSHCPVDLHWTWNRDENRWESPCICVVKFDTKADERRVEEFISMDAPFKILIVGLESLSQASAVDNPGKAGRAYSVTERFMLAHRCMHAIDEAHGIKGHDSNRTVNCIQLGHLAKYKLLMTGSPILQGLLDLYSYFEYLDPNIIGLGDWYSFRARYAILSDDGYNRVVAYDNVEELLSATSPYIYQITKKECLDLPDKLPPQTRFVQLHPDQRAVYNDIKKKKLYEKGSIRVLIENALQKYSALQTIVGGFINWDKEEVGLFKPDGTPKVVRATEEIVDWKSNPKIRETLQVLEELGDEQVIIWAMHTFEIQQLCAAIRAKYGPDSVAEYHGGIKAGDARDRQKHNFRSGAAKYWVGNPAAGGVGITINESAYVIYYSNSFKLIHRVQSEDRNHRIGQTRHVTYIDIVAENTVDIDIIAAIVDKKDFADWVKDQFASGRQAQLAIF